MKAFLPKVAAGVLLVSISGCSTETDSLAPNLGEPSASRAASPGHESHPRFDIIDFSKTRRFRLIGDAHVQDQALRLTDDQTSQVGAAWTRTRQRVGRGFETTFSFRIRMSECCIGADGLAFIIQDFGPDALGADGGGLGYAGIPRSLAVEVDLWENYEFGETGRNHIAVHTRGIAANSEQLGAELGAVTPSIEMADGSVHTIRIRYTPGTLSVFLDGGETPVLVVAVDLTSIGGASILEKSGRAWVGLTAATGAVSESHDIVEWAFTSFQGR